MTPKPPNAEGQTLCTVRWMLETPGGWLGAWDREAFAEIERLRAERDELQQQTLAWVKENAPGGWINDMRVERDSLAVAYEQVRHDCRNLTEKVIPNLRAERDEAVGALPQKREPLTEAQVVACLVEAGCLGTVTLSFDHGSYEITRSSHKADKFARAIERAHGIGA